MPSDSELPPHIDPELWFWSVACDGRDYLEPTIWHTELGQMAAYCPHDDERREYRIARDQLPDELPTATRYFVVGFLSGNVPNRPWELDDPADPSLLEWERAARRFLVDGRWCVEADLDQP